MAEDRILAWLLLGSWPIAFLILFLAVDPIPQDPAFHAFAPSGAWMGVPHFWNVVSNLPLLIPGILGLRFLQRQGGLAQGKPEATFFFGLLLTALGSAYYHWAPDTETLVWDRMPMTITFMGFFLAMVAHCVSRATADRFLVPALLLGIGSVLYWAWTESLARGDLRPYAVVQFLPLLLVAVLLLRFHPPSLRRKALWCVPLAYALAKLCEFADHAMAEVLPFALTGHAIKHLFAAAAGFAFLRAFRVPYADEA